MKGIVCSLQNVCTDATKFPCSDFCTAFKAPRASSRDYDDRSLDFQCQECASLKISIHARRRTHTNMIGRNEYVQSLGCTAYSWNCGWLYTVNPYCSWGRWQALENCVPTAASPSIPRQGNEPSERSCDLLRRESCSSHEMEAIAMNEPSVSISSCGVVNNSCISSL